MLTSEWRPAAPWTRTHHCLHPSTVPCAMHQDPHGHTVAMRSDARGELTSSVDAVARGLGPYASANYTGPPPLRRDGMKADWQMEQLMVYHYQGLGLLGDVRGFTLPALVVRAHAGYANGAWTKGVPIERLGLSVKYPVSYLLWHPTCVAMLLKSCSHAHTPSTRHESREIASANPKVNQPPQLAPRRGRRGKVLSSGRF